MASRVRDLFAILIAAAITSCDTYGPDDHFIPGEVIAGVQNVEPAFIADYAAAHGITVKEIFFPPTFIVLAGVPSGKGDDYIAVLTADSLVYAADIGPSVRVFFLRSADEAYARNLLESQGPTYSDPIRFDDHVVFGVPVGSERRWMRRLRKESFVKYTERNQVAETGTRTATTPGAAGAR